MKSTHGWYKEEIAHCLMELLDTNYNPDRKHERGWLERCEFVLDIIEHFISSSMKIGHNPLSSLRKQFPFLDWKYVNYGDGSQRDGELQCFKDVGGCDFFWFAVDGQGWHLVLATRRKFIDGQAPCSLFGSICQIESEDSFGSSMIEIKYLERYRATQQIRNAK